MLGNSRPMLENSLLPLPLRKVYVLAGATHERKYKGEVCAPRTIWEGKKRGGTSYRCRCLYPVFFLMYKPVNLIIT